MLNSLKYKRTGKSWFGNPYFHVGVIPT